MFCLHTLKLSMCITHFDFHVCIFSNPMHPHAHINTQIAAYRHCSTHTVNCTLDWPLVLYSYLILLWETVLVNWLVIGPLYSLCLLWTWYLSVMTRVHCHHSDQSHHSTLPVILRVWIEGVWMGDPWERESVCVYVCVCVRERERVMYVDLCVCEWGSDLVCFCVMCDVCLSL